MLLLEGTLAKYNFTKGSNSGEPFVVNGRRILLFEEVKNDILLLTSGDDHLLATSRSLWDASIILAEYLRENGLPPQDLIIELGSGYALPSITASVLGAKRVLITDGKGCTDVARSSTDIANVRVDIKELDWTSKQLQVDVQDCISDAKSVLVLAADVIWVDELVQSLVNTLNALLCNSQNSLMLAYQERTSRVTEHFKQGLESVGIALTALTQHGKVTIYQGRRRQDEQA